MKPKQFLLLALSVASLLTSCEKVDGSGPTVTETRTLATVGGIDVRLAANVVVTQGAKSEVRLEAQHNVLDVLQTNVNGDRLQINFGHTVVRSHDPIRVYVTAPSLSTVIVSSSAKVSSPSTWSPNRLQINASGSGNLDLTCAQVSDVQSTVSGSGNVTLHGTAESQAANLSGSGHLKAYELSTQDADITASGAGNSEVQVARKLSVRLRGSGTVRYKGRPALTTQISGSGKVVDAN